MSGGSPAEAERAVLASIDSDRIVERARTLVRVPSVGGREGPAQELVARWLGEDGLEVDRWSLDLDRLARHPAYGAEVDRATAEGVVGVLGGRSGGPELVLNGHVDVVPVGHRETWTVPPFGAVVRDGWIHGRGAADMKGGLVAALEAVGAVARSGIRLRGGVRVQSVVGEEDGGVGTLAALLRGHGGDGAVVLEPTDLAVVTAQAGAASFRLVVPGRAAHGALRTEGVSAVEKFEVLHRALGELEARRNARFRDDPRFRDHEIPAPISVGTVRAGTWASSVPDRLVAEGRYGIGVGESPEAARRELEEAVREAAGSDAWLREHPPRVEWWGGRFEPAETDPGRRVVRTLRAAHRDLAGEEPPLGAVPYGSDMRLLVHEGGVPAVLYGPGSPRLAHGPDERVAVDELVRAARTVALLVLRFCGRG